METTIKLFNIIIFASFRSEEGGWFRILGIGMTWTHSSIRPMFSERIGKRKKLTIRNYRYGYLKPCNIIIR